MHEFLRENRIKEICKHRLCCSFHRYNFPRMTPPLQQTTWIWPAIIEYYHYIASSRWLRRPQLKLVVGSCMELTHRRRLLTCSTELTENLGRERAAGTV